MIESAIDTGVASLTFKGRVAVYYILFFLFYCFLVKQIAFGVSLAPAALHSWNAAWLMFANGAFLFTYAVEAFFLYREEGSLARMSVVRMTRFNESREADLYLWIFISILYFTLQRLCETHPWFIRHLPFVDMSAVLGSDIASFFFLSFLGYLIHFLSHKIPFLWELHKIHHSAKEMTGFTVSREHLFFEFFHLFMFASIFRMNDLCIGKVFLARGALYVIQHTEINSKFGWLGQVIFSPHSHHIHHQNDPELSAKNFGLDITLWDRIFGSFLYEIPKTAAEIDSNYGLPPNEGSLGHNHIFVDQIEAAKRALAVLRGGSKS
jgi:sterol desaturase/sphingolipid hydroxylase (fatty acid hydroxylase superfamily)